MRLKTSRNRITVDQNRYGEAGWIDWIESRSDLNCPEEECFQGWVLYHIRTHNGPCGVSKMTGAVR